MPGSTKAASGGELRRGESIEGLYTAYKVMVQGYIPGTSGLCNLPPLVTPVV